AAYDDDHKLIEYLAEVCGNRIVARSILTINMTTRKTSSTLY
ncbi:3772_t:CDS:1, partial [Paraglomus occultum]